MFSNLKLLLQSPELFLSILHLQGMLQLVEKTKKNTFKHIHIYIYMFIYIIYSTSLRIGDVLMYVYYIILYVNVGISKVSTTQINTLHSEI